MTNKKTNAKEYAKENQEFNLGYEKAIDDIKKIIEVFLKKIKEL